MHLSASWLLVAAAVATVAHAVSPGSCDEWSVWETRPWGGTRRREGCADGRVEEQCRSDSGLVIRCSANVAFGGAADAVAAAPMLDARRPLRKNFATFRSSSGSGSGTGSAIDILSSLGSTSNGTYVCNTGCIVGYTAGGIVGLAVLIGIVFGFYTLMAQQGTVVRVAAAGTAAAAKTSATTAGSTVTPSNAVPAASTANLITVSPVPTELALAVNGCNKGLADNKLDVTPPAYDSIYPDVHVEEPPPPEYPAGTSSDQQDELSVVAESAEPSPMPSISS